MAGFLYFLVGGKNVDAENVEKKAGLGYAFDGGCASRDVLAGAAPIGKTGCVIGDPNSQPEDRPLGYHPDRQTWRKIPAPEGAPEVWLGWWNDAQPRPADVRRQTQFRTANAKLDDDCWWAIPLIGHQEHGAFVTDLPARLDLNDRGGFVAGEVVERYRDLWEAIAPLADKHFAWQAGEGQAPTDDEQWQAVLTLLGATHRVGVAELVAMGAFHCHRRDDGSVGPNMETAARVWMVATAYDMIERALESAQKKTTPMTGESANTSAG